MGSQALWQVLERSRCAGAANSGLRLDRLTHGRAAAASRGILAVLNALTLNAVEFANREESTDLVDVVACI